jgi:uncharacterized protein (DUF1330 family)
MSVYIVARIEIHDRDRYGEYEAGFMAIFERHAGELLAVDEAPEVVEGSWSPTRTVLIRFPDRDAAMAWYRSADYQALAEHRFAASTADIALLAGLG